MSARDELAELAGRRNYPSRFEDADRILAEHAHELAEKLRAVGRGELPGCKCEPYCCSCSVAADLIDPEALK